MKKLLLSMCLGLPFAAALRAQSKQVSWQLPAEMVSFFVGEWSGEGAFANGRTIAAKLSVKLTLDSAWLSFDHQDSLPNRFQSHSLMGVDQGTGQLETYVFDNFHGHRHFYSNGWIDGKLVLTAPSYTKDRGLVFEHFVYERSSLLSFAMTYETSQDGMIWKLGDRLVFRKVIK